MMASLSLVDAFAQFGAKPLHRLRGLSAIAEDGALVLSCAAARFQRPGRGVLRYEDTLSRDPADQRGTALLGEHLTAANEGQAPVRMVVISAAPAGKTGRTIHVRSDLVGKITKFDGDHFIVDFSYPETRPVPKRHS